MLITGGASGIGRIMGRICLEKGASNLIVWDINQANIDKTEAELSDVKPAEAGVSKGQIHSYIVNVSDPQAIKSAYEKVKSGILARIFKPFIILSSRSSVSALGSFAYSFKTSI